MVVPISNPPSPWESTHAEWLGEPPEAKLEVFEEQARSIVAENDSPDVGFRYSVNPYRGCFHACAYCLSGETPVLLASGRAAPLSDIHVGDEVIGTRLVGRYRRYVRSRVLAHWSRIAPAFRVVLEDGTRLVASADHRFLTQRGWKHVCGAGSGRGQRPHLTPSNELLGTGRFAPAPEENAAYRTGYLCGMVRGDGLLRSYTYSGGRRVRDVQHQFRLALTDFEALERTRRYLADFEVGTHPYVFQAAVGRRRPLNAIRTSARDHFARIVELIDWPNDPSDDWTKGFLAGIFDAEGSSSGGILRICNTDREIIDRIRRGLARFGFDYVVEERNRERPIFVVRVGLGLREHLRFLHTTDPAITRKRSIEGQAIKNDSALRVVAVEPLGVALRLFDITTESGDFIADGVVSHNCYARTSHEYLGFGAGTDFDRKIVVKVNAAERLREQFSRKSWKGDFIAFSGNTDCYQPLEAVFGLTRACLEVCLEFANPVGVITKSALVRRDVDLLARLARDARAGVTLSIPFADDAMARAIEPGTSPPSQRFETLKILSDAGIPTRVGIAPVIPGLNDGQVAEILRRARAAGASLAFMLPVRLAGATLPVFRERLEAAYPDRAAKVWSAILQIRKGKWNESKFGDRMTGAGPRWAAIQALYRVECRRLGLDCGEDDEEDEEEKRPTPFRRPTPQRGLFE
jgi:DNA repair photolyase